MKKLFYNDTFLCILAGLTMLACIVGNCYMHEVVWK